MSQLANPAAVDRSDIPAIFDPVIISDETAEQYQPDKVEEAEQAHTAGNRVEYHYHYNQRFGDWGGADALQRLLDALSVDREGELTVIGGFTGEVAAELDHDHPFRGGGPVLTERRASDIRSEAQASRAGRKLPPYRKHNH